MTIGATTTAPAFASSGPPLRAAATLGCGLFSASKLSALLGEKVSTPSTTVAGPTTTCDYPSSTGAVIVQYVTGYTMAQFNANTKSDNSHGETTTSVAGYGNAAVSVSLGKVLAGFDLIKGSYGFNVDAIVSLSHLEAVAKQVLPKL